MLTTVHDDDTPVSKYLEIRVESAGETNTNLYIVSVHGGRCSVGRVGHGIPKILVGWATMNLAPPIIGLYVR